MIKKIKEYFEVNKNYREAKKAVTLMLLNQYSDLLTKELEAKEAEIKAYESMTVFGDSFNPEDLKNVLSGIDKIANSPELQTSYYEMIHADAQKEKSTV